MSPLKRYLLLTLGCFIGMQLGAWVLGVSYESVTLVTFAMVLALGISARVLIWLLDPTEGKFKVRDRTGGIARHLGQPWPGPESELEVAYKGRRLDAWRLYARLYVMSVKREREQE